MYMGSLGLNFRKAHQKSDPYVFASQVQQVFYVEDPTEKMIYNVIKKVPRDCCDIEKDDANEGHENEEPMVHTIPLVPEVDNQVIDSSWMEKMFNLRFHHQGQFQSTRYAGGKETVVMDIDPDLFSYTVLMEHVKDDLQYSEIGGVYIETGKLFKWKLVTCDSDLSSLIEKTGDGEYIDFYVDNVIDNDVQPIKQMQPHVVIRPRHNLLQAKKLSNWVLASLSRLDKLEKYNEATSKSASARRKLDLQNPPHEDETMGENVTELDLKKLKSKDKQKEKTRDGSEDYDPAQDDGSDAAGSVSPTKGLYF
ncbi:uncharacterized protein LOC108207459 [Rhizophagus clarus]|uniref:Uncharacterized protein LOC108207459 n=1 Tax=Rhizophagus clarus TaxID=94130 RepID=A0A8H3MGZ3_9GLOM|nr:uncharacterized protein LOC108207459 [Rhizophagus clarus]